MPKYREPTAADVGGDVEVKYDASRLSGFGDGERWYRVKLLAIVDGPQRKFVFPHFKEFAEAESVKARVPIKGWPKTKPRTGRDFDDC